MNHFKTLIVISLLAVAQPAVAEDWQTWIEQRTIELREQKNLIHFEHCSRLDQDLNAALADLKTEWDLSGPSEKSRSAAKSAHRIALRGFAEGCGSQFIKTMDELWILIDEFPE